MFRWIPWRRRSRRAGDVLRDPAPVTSTPLAAAPRATIAPPADAPVEPETGRLAPPPGAADNLHLQPRVPPPTSQTPYLTYRPGLIDPPESGTEDEVTELSPDEAHVGHLLQYLGKGRVTDPTFGELSTISIVGRLRDGSIAWVNAQEQWCGRFPATMLGGIAPIEGDTVRARVISHPWGSTVESIAPNTHRSQFASRSVSTAFEPSPAPPSEVGS